MPMPKLEKPTGGTSATRKEWTHPKTEGATYFKIKIRIGPGNKIKKQKCKYLDPHTSQLNQTKPGIPKIFKSLKGQKGCPRGQRWPNMNTTCMISGPSMADKTKNGGQSPENPNKVPEPQLKQPPFRQVRSSQGDRRTWGGVEAQGASEGLSLN
ncbi:hypothetical protein CEXT_352241 [Caerostris extrusa]|uniref:Uncharacterized protein n=1 Tax=Caerostris extrusa TaxID=172846 RepID=A0AAV4WJK4_CAEEX|nr:hypothetical protein CEXT_352241 [Caerostris extrusa]